MPYITVGKENSGNIDRRGFGRSSQPTTGYNCPSGVWWMRA